MFCLMLSSFGSSWRCSIMNCIYCATTRSISFSRLPLISFVFYVFISIFFQFRYYISETLNRHCVFHGFCHTLSQNYFILYGFACTSVIQKLFNILRMATIKMIYCFLSEKQSHKWIIFPLDMKKQVRITAGS